MVAGIQTKQIKIEGRVSVEPIELPGDMTTEEIATVQRRRVDDILVVLERNRAELEERLNSNANALVPNIGIVTSQLTFAADGAEFGVQLEAQGQEGKNFNSSEWSKQLPSLVSQTLSDFIHEIATSVGFWQPVIATDAEKASSSAGLPKADDNARPYMLVLSIAGVLIIAACVLAALFAFV